MNGKQEGFLTDDKLRVALATLLGWRKREETLHDVGANNRLLTINVAIEAINECIRANRGGQDESKLCNL
jgi:hypothetical protein